MENLKRYWTKLNEDFVFKNEKLRIVFETSNPVYGKCFCIYVQDLSVYEVTERGTNSSDDRWRHYHPKVEKDVLDIIKEKLILEEKKKKHKELLKLNKELAEQERIKSILDNY